MENFIKRYFFFLFTFLLFLSTVSIAEEVSSSSYIDTHMHLNGRYQKMPEPQGRRPRPQMVEDYEAAAANLISEMNQLGIEKSVIMPPPQAPNQKGSYTYKALLGAIKKYSNRLVLAAGGGELSPLLVGTDPLEVTPEMTALFTQKAEEIIRAGAKAFGEMAALHYSFSPRHGFHQTPADHPLFLTLADIAAQHDMPIDLHMEAVPEDQPTPPMLLQRSSNNPSLTKATIPGLERLLEHNRNAKIVWTHVGWDNTGHLTVSLLRRLLETHSNLYAAIKFVRREYEPFGLGNKVLDESTGEINAAWLQLLNDFPDRFMIGADDFIGIEGVPRQAGPPSFADTWSIVGKLPPGLRQKIGRENAARVYRL